MTKTDEYLWITEKLILLSYYFEIEGALFSYVQKKKRGTNQNRENRTSSHNIFKFKMTENNEI